MDFDEAKSPSMLSDEDCLIDTQPAEDGLLGSSSLSTDVDGITATEQTTLNVMDQRAIAAPLKKALFLVCACACSLCVHFVLSLFCAGGKEAGGPGIDAIRRQ